ncbi:MAG: hypothetical protein ACI4L7_01430 [Christensenellales bacterium]
MNYMYATDEIATAMTCFNNMAVFSRLHNILCILLKVCPALFVIFYRIFADCQYPTFHRKNKNIGRKDSGICKKISPIKFMVTEVGK